MKSRVTDKLTYLPAQVISYKVGADRITTLKNLAMKKLADQYKPAEFHHQILGYGGVITSSLFEEND